MDNEIDSGTSFKLANELRSNRREQQKQQQKFNRFGAFEKNRFADSEIVNESDVKSLCSRIKRRKRASAEDLQRLGNAFLQSELNISEFIKVTGAIGIIVKEFTGTDRNQQLLAAQCLCNLSLGDEISCSKIATFAGSYLMIFMLNSSDASFTRICLWITQNIVAAGSKSTNILVSQELLKNCLHVLNNSIEHEQEAVQLLDLIIDAKWNELELEEKREIEGSVWNVLKKSFDDPAVLQVLLKVIDGAWNFSQEQSDQLVIMMTTNLIEATASDSNENVLPFTLKLLSMAFANNPQNIVTSLDFLAKNNVKLSELVNKAVVSVKHFSVVPQLMQFIATIYTSQYFTNDSLEDWKIPKIFEF